MRASTSMSVTAGRILVVLGVGALATTAVAGPDWDEKEHGDAGNLPGSAQVTVGNEPNGLQSIRGSLDGFGLFGGDFQDMFVIEIASPGSFSATVSMAGTTFDTQMFLFDASGFGLLGNDNTDPGGPPFSGFGNMSTDGTDIEILEPGTYLLAISGSDSDPLGINSTTGGLEEIFDMPLGSFEVSGPDGTGGMSPISGWSGPGATGDYLIELVGTDFAVSPSPGALAMLLLAGCARRRRRG